MRAISKIHDEKPKTYSEIPEHIIDEALKARTESVKQVRIQKRNEKMAKLAAYIA